MDKDIKDAMAKGTKGIENLMGSQTSLNRRVRKTIAFFPVYEPRGRWFESSSENTFFVEICS